jgi:hypothetical protein
MGNSHVVDMYGQTAYFRDRAVHPHARRDNTKTDTAALVMTGSPPCAWGQPVLVFREGPFVRFTPTRVGATSPDSRCIRWLPVHPHACGDNSSKVIVNSSPSGSPPRAWGQRSRLQPDVLDNRFTPTRVGTTLRYRRAWRHHTVHPHARGDDAWHGATEIRPKPKAFPGPTPRRRLLRNLSGSLTSRMPS